MDDQTHSLLSSLQRIPHSSEGLQQLLEVAEAARTALSSDPDGLHELAERLVSWSTGSEDSAEAARVLIESARIRIELSGDWEYGVDLYERALKRAPTELAALHRVERLLTVREAWERLEVVLLTHANALDYEALYEVELRGEAWRRLGQLRASRLSDLDGAIVAYDTALEVHPEPTWMLELAELYDQRNQADDPAAAAQLYYRAADIIDGPAVTPYLERALDRDPHHEAALEMLEALTPPEDVGKRLEQRWRAFAADAPAGEKRTSVVQRLANHYAHGVASAKTVEKLSQTLSPPPPSYWGAKMWLRFRKPHAAARSQAPLRSGRTLLVGGASLDRDLGTPSLARAPLAKANVTLRGVPDFETPSQPGSILGQELLESRTPIPERPAGWYRAPAAAFAFAIIVLWSAPQFRVLVTAIGAASPSENTPLPDMPVIQPRAVSALPVRTNQDAEAVQAVGTLAIPEAPTPSKEPERRDHALNALPAHEADTGAARSTEAAEAAATVDVAPPRFRVTNGSMPEPEFTAVLTGVQRKLEHCAAGALASHSDPRGSMVLSWLIKPHGRSTKVRYRRGSTDDREARLCAQEVLRRTRFPKPSAGNVSVEATFKLAYAQQDGRPGE